MALVVMRSNSDHGLLLLIWLFVSVWAADISAYFAGRLIGGPKLAPVISPKKTWAGLGGAMAGAAIASLGVALFAGLNAPLALSLVGTVLGVVEQAGDLFKSALKRHYGVKDSGRLIPGHGGVIDRVDGLVASAVAVLILGYLFGGPQSAGSDILPW
jgi:phosphatidate cytidylyltransferase